nr:MAG TPA: hypothetical protein [Caudoviricetes sp.]
MARVIRKKAFKKSERSSNLRQTTLRKRSKLTWTR